MCTISVGACVMVHIRRSEDIGIGSHLLPFKFRPSGLYGRGLPTGTASAFRIRRVVGAAFETAGNQVSLARNPKERGMKGFI